MPVHSAHIRKRLRKLLALDPACRILAIAGLSLGGLVSNAGPPLVVFADEATPMSSSAEASASPRAAAAWLFDQQLADGGFPGPTGASDPEPTIDAVLAAYAWGVRLPQSDILPRARNYLFETGPAYAARGPGQAARLALAALALGESPGAFGGEDPVYCDNIGSVGSLNLFSLVTAPAATPERGLMPAFGHVDIRDRAYVMLALSAMYEPVLEAALASLRTAQAPNGGWAQDGSSDPDAADAITTALVVQALSVTELSVESDGSAGLEMIDRGIAFLHSLRVPSGGFAYSSREPLVADAASTAAVIQALKAAGEEPASPEWGNAPQALAAYQTPSGGFRARVGDDRPDLGATLQALPALVEAPLPDGFDCYLE